MSRGGDHSHLEDWFRRQVEWEKAREETRGIGKVGEDKEVKSNGKGEEGDTPVSLKWYKGGWRPWTATGNDLSTWFQHAPNLFWDFSVTGLCVEVGPMGSNGITTFPAPNKENRCLCFKSETYNHSWNTWNQILDIEKNWRAYLWLHLDQFHTITGNVHVLITLEISLSNWQKFTGTRLLQ